MMLSMMLICDNCDDVEEGGVPAAVDCLGMRGSALLSQLPGQGIRYYHSSLIATKLTHLLHDRNPRRVCGQRPL